MRRMGSKTRLRRSPKLTKSNQDATHLTRIVDSRDDELLQLKSVVNDLRERQHQVFVNVNNHYEGSAPRTIEKIKAFLLELENKNEVK